MKQGSKIYQHAHLAYALIVMLCVVIMSASSAYAFSYTSPTGTVIQCDIDEHSIASNVVLCIKKASILTAEPLLAEVSAAFLPITMAALTLALTLLGAQMALFEPKPDKPIMIFLIRFGVVLLLADNFGSTFFGDAPLSRTIFEIMEEMQASVIPVLYQGGEGAVCSAAAQSAQPSGSDSASLNAITNTPWVYLDCILDYVFGFGRDATLAASLFGFVGSALASGSMGTMVFVMGVTLIFSLLTLVLRTVYAVVACYVFAAFLIVLAPIFASMLMFTYTQPMFKAWYQNIVTCIVVPFVMVCYLGVGLPILDSFVFNPDEESNSLVTTLGQGEEITETYRNEEPICSVTSRSDFEFFEEAQGFGRMIRDTLVPMNTGANDWCGFLNVNTVDMGPDQIKRFFDIALSLLKILFIVWLITSGSALVVDMAVRLAGGSGRGLATTAISASLPLQGRVESMLRRAGQGQSMFGGGGGIGTLFGGGR
ncbi:MAG: hypothetical protein EAY76_05175 [Alphaproteobacteria bacterium]|nr:MAG: hypothetical protein EAY76_05175 [Alphaproteobacteria bacterium]TAF40223.1 MAG: hypothetical protein EAZ66_03485 [Alphaproteobacteria bacterium]TAF77353.1 MAG: hypothetical protein EAZ52_00630 [Alphaproteobacteria bacterium]